MAKPPSKPKDASRTAIVSVRFDPKLKYLAELAARKHRRPLSNYIEAAVEKSLGDVRLSEDGGGNEGYDPVTVGDVANELWDVDDSERFARLAIKFPELLDVEEQERWKIIMDSRLFEPAIYRNGSRLTWDWEKLTRDIFPTLRMLWQSLLMEQSEGNGLEWAKNIREMTAPSKGKSSPFDNEEIPF